MKATKITCESCGHSFNLAATLRRHVNTVHEGYKDHLCVFCSESFAQSWTLRRHMDSFHKDNLIANTTKPKDFSENYSLNYPRN